MKIPLGKKWQKGKEFTQLKNLKEHRHYYRYEIDLTSAFRDEGTIDFNPAKIVNISAVGGYLKSKKPLRSGGQIKLRFQLPGRSKKIINCLAKIIWSAKFEGYHGGIKFVNIKRIDQYRITGFIRNDLKKKNLKFNKHSYNLKKY